jgi:hypothetical protein
MTQHPESDPRHHTGKTKRKRSAPQQEGTLEDLPGGPAAEQSHAPRDWRAACPPCTLRPVRDNGGSVPGRPPERGPCW